MMLGLSILEWVLATLLGFLLTRFFKFYLAWPIPRLTAGSLFKSLSNFRQCNNDSERQILAMQTAAISFRFVLLLSMPFTLAIVLLSLAQYCFGANISSIYFLSLTTLAGIATWFGYPFTPAKSGVATQSYGALSRLLHHAVLGSQHIRKSTFNFSVQQLKRNFRSSKTAGPDVLIMGMARSGTSLVLRLISEDHRFNVLRYKDMPFVLAPGFWRKLSQPHHRPVNSVSRIHDDGLLNNSESPEAFEEIFWETFRTEKSSTEQFGNKPDEQALANFSVYKNIVCSLGENESGRYLSKNNNSLIRMVELASDRQNIILIVYREPRSASTSMHRTHERFCNLMNNDEFSKSYLRWLAHFEFGPLHKPFQFAKNLMNPKYRVEDSNYWLDYWCVVHRYIIDQAPASCVLLNYDQLCAQPQTYLNALGKRLESTVAEPEIGAIAKRFKNNCNTFEDSLIIRADSIYQELIHDPRNLITIFK